MFETINIGKEFDSLEACEKWEEENLPNRTYNGRTVLCVQHTEKAWNGRITLDSITVL